MITYAFTSDGIVAFADSASSGITYQCPHCFAPMSHVEKDGLGFFRLRRGAAHKYDFCQTWEKDNNVFLLKNFAPPNFITDLMQPEKA